jgi:sugar (pentulose or hexulose) kinase
MADSLYLGIDFGTSGARAIAIDPNRQIQAQASIRFDSPTHPDWATIWRSTLFNIIQQIPLELRQSIEAIAINGTSSTVLICDREGNPLDRPILYNDARGASALSLLSATAPPNHTVLSATSSLAKLLWWATDQDGISRWRDYGSPSSRSGDRGTPESPLIYFMHQADWLAWLLHGRPGISDYHNALKLGYDVGELRYPDWLKTLPLPFQLPYVVAPGTAIAPVQPDVAAQLGLKPSCQVCAGTTDSIAAFLASDAQVPGDAVTSLGSTLVLKLLSQTRVDDAHYGIYSHRLGDLWLVGGASNTGGAVLQQFFSDAELQCLSQQIHPEEASLLDYYPLPAPGERFPINDAGLRPRLDPQPDSPVAFLHGLLESIARIEAQGYQLLQQLGASPLKRVYTAGGGAKNTTWTAIRSRQLQVPVTCSTQTDAAFGTALLALKGASKD